MQLVGTVLLFLATSVLQTAAQTCGASDGEVDVPKGASVVPVGDRLIVMTETDTPAGISSVSSGAYICRCDEGKGFCNPSESKNGKIGCYGFGGCTKCSDPIELVLGGSIGAVMDILYHRICPNAIANDDTVVEERAKAIDEWASRQQPPIPPPRFQGKKKNKARASRGYSLVGELVGSSWLVYQVPDENFDETGNLKTPVGPANFNTHVKIYQMAAGGSSRCYCALSGAPASCECEFSRGGAYGLCKGGCCSPENSQQSYCAIQTATGNAAAVAARKKNGPK